MAGRAKENLPGGSLKYLFVYFKIRIYLNVVAVCVVIFLKVSHDITQVTKA